MGERESRADLGRQVQRARSRAFVGRGRERQLIAGSLRGDAGSPRVFYVHGAGGIGKTSLLRQTAVTAAESGREVVEVDGRFVERSTQRFAEQAHPIGSLERGLLLVDTFEVCQSLEAWLLDRFLPQLSVETVVVVASRRPPSLEWTVDPGWRSAVRVLPLGALDRAESAELLTAHGLEPSRLDAVLNFAGGSPLTLSLAAAVADLASGATTSSWTPSAEVLRILLSRLVGDVPTRSHQRALEAVALASTMDEALLDVALDGDDGSLLFGWLRDLPFIETSERGLFPHDAVREVLVADLAWRDARSLNDIRRRLTSALLARVRAQGDDTPQVLMDQLMYLYRHDLTPALSWDDEEPLEVEQLAPDDLPAVEAMVRDIESDAIAELVRFWYARQPEGFSLYRAARSQEVIGFSARLEITAPADRVELATDPVLEAAWEHVDSVGGMDDGERFAMTRFEVHAQRPDQPTQITTLVMTRALASLARRDGIRHGFRVGRNAARWPDWLGAMLHDTGARPVIDGISYALYSNDWRAKPFERWLDEVLGTTPSEEPARPLRPGPESSRTEFDEAVREGLKLWGRRDGLRAARLGGLLAGPGAVEEPPDEVDVDAAARRAVREALADMQTDEATLRGHDAVVATYLSQIPTQKAAARRLGLTFSTYRRHLRAGLDDLSDRLWQRRDR